MVAQTLMTAAPLVTARPDLSFGGLPKTGPLPAAKAVFLKGILDLSVFH
jgi:hypothetical protein